MRIRLTDGSYLESLNKDIPSKRKVKNGGGSLKSYNSRQTGKNVGGTTNTSRAIYSGFEINPDDGSVVIDPHGRPTCVTVDSRKRNYTWNLGGNCSTGYIGGKGV